MKEMHTHAVPVIMTEHSSSNPIIQWDIKTRMAMTTCIQRNCILSDKIVFGCRNSIVECIYPIVIYILSIFKDILNCSQHSICTAEVHYNDVKHFLKYLWMIGHKGYIFGDKCP